MNTNENLTDNVYIVSSDSSSEDEVEKTNTTISSSVRDSESNNEEQSNKLLNDDIPTSDNIQTYADYVFELITKATDPETVLKDLILETRDSSKLYVLKSALDILIGYNRREKLKNYNTIDDFVYSIANCSNIIVIAGAGISVNCGIPDFRSANGIYSKLVGLYPELNSPQDMFSINFFKYNPEPFYRFAKTVYPGNFLPSKSHYFIKKLEQAGKLLRLYTQNIDTLEHVADIKNLIQCHGSFATAHCMQCKYEYKCDDIKESILKQEVPICKKCISPERRNVIKPDVIFFGEDLPKCFYDNIKSDMEKCDLLIVMGSSMKVSPVAEIPDNISESIPTILINNESIRHINFDVELIGDCDKIVTELEKRIFPKENENVENFNLTEVSVKHFLKSKGYPIEDNTKVRLASKSNVLDDGSEEFDNKKPSFVQLSFAKE
ncbi:hypothetical protein A3Q56_07625, partial [Intoshia linei]